MNRLSNSSIRHKAPSQNGGALIYILIAIALLAALTTTFIQPGGQSSRTQNANNLAMQMQSQGRIIRSAIQDCILRFSQGNSSIAEVGYNAPYPLNPDSAEFTVAATSKNVSLLECPGTDSTDVDNQTALFSGSGEFSSYLPGAPDFMDDWTYFNGNATGGSQIFGLDFNGVFFQISSNKSDPHIGEAMTRIDNLHAACEVDYTVGDGTNGCENGYQCLRYWIIRTGSTGPVSDGSPNPCT